MVRNAVLVIRAVFTHWAVPPGPTATDPSPNRSPRRGAAFCSPPRAGEGLGEGSVAAASHAYEDVREALIGYLTRAGVESRLVLSSEAEKLGAAGSGR